MFREVVLSAAATVCVRAAVAEVDLSRNNPVTGETQNFGYYFNGTTSAADVASAWYDAAGANPSAVPGAPGSNLWEPILVDGDLATGSTAGEDGFKSVTFGTLEGWNMRVGVFNHVSASLGEPNKFQGGQGCFIMVDETSRASIDYHQGSSVGTISLYVAGRLDFARFTQGSTADYYLKGTGTVAYAAAPTAGSHVLKRGDITLSPASGYTAVVKKYLVTFASGSREFDLAGASISAKDADGQAVELSAKGVVTAVDGIGTYALGQDAGGVYISYVDYTDEEPIPETATLVLDGGETDVSVAANWMGGRDPGENEDAVIVVKSASILSIPSARTLGKLTVTGPGSLQIGVSGSQVLSVSELVADADLSFQPGTLAPGLVTVNEGKTATYRMYANATLAGIRGGGAFEVFAGIASEHKTLTLHKNAFAGGATATGVAVKLHHGTIHLGSGQSVGSLLNDVRFELDDGTAITQYGWAACTGTVEVFVDADCTASAFTQSKLSDNGAFKKTGAGTLEVNAALCTASARVEAGALVLGTANGWDHTAAISSGSDARVVKKAGTTAQVSGTLSLDGGLQIQEGGAVNLTGSSESLVWGVAGPGALTVSGTGALCLGKSGFYGFSAGAGALVNVNAATVKLGRYLDIVGSTLGDCTFVLNGGGMSAYGWIDVKGTVVFDAVQDGTMSGNDYNRTSAAGGKLVKRGAGVLDWRSDIDCPVRIEAGTLDKKTNSDFTIGESVAVDLAGADAKLLVPEAKSMTSVSSSVNRYKVVRSVTEGVATYSLEKRGGFFVIVN